MKRITGILAALLLSAGIAISLTGCKEETIIKSNLDPSGIETNVINDSLTVWTKTIYDDSVITSGTYEGIIVHGLGTVNDAFFGRTNAGIYFQLLPPKPASPLSSNPYTVDSAFVVLPVAGHLWGDTTSTMPAQSFNVYRVTEDMPEDSLYFSFTKKAYDPTPVGSITGVNLYNVFKVDSPVVFDVKRPTHLRIRLDQSFAQALDDAAKTGTDNAAFLTAIKGLYIAPQDTNNSSGRTLAYFLMNGSSDYNRAAVQIFYHEQDSTEKAIFFNYVPSTCSHYNRISRNYTGSQAAQYLNSTAQSDDVVLLENEPGAAIDIRIPYLKNLPEGIVNVAQLVISKAVLPGDPDNAFEHPSRIAPVGVDAAGGLYNILDWPGTNTEASAFLDGYPKTLDLGGGLSTITYTLNIPRTIQNAIVNKLDELHLRINGSRNYYAGARITAGGRTYSNIPLRIRMNITYSKLK